MRHINALKNIVEDSNFCNECVNKWIWKYSSSSIIMTIFKQSVHLLLNSENLRATKLYVFFKRVFFQLKLSHQSYAFLLHVVIITPCGVCLVNREIAQFRLYQNGEFLQFFYAMADSILTIYFFIDSRLALIHLYNKRSLLYKIDPIIWTKLKVYPVYITDLKCLRFQHLFLPGFSELLLLPRTERVSRSLCFDCHDLRFSLIIWREGGLCSPRPLCEDGVVTRRIEIYFLESWSDGPFLGLSGLEVISSSGTVLPISICQVFAFPRDLGSLSLIRGSRMLENLIRKPFVTTDPSFMWLTPLRYHGHCSCLVVVLLLRIDNRYALNALPLSRDFGFTTIIPIQ